jgi:hypothetical protein
MRKAGTAEPRPQLEAVLQRLLLIVVIVVGHVLHDDGVITFTDFSPLLGLGLSSLRNLDSLRGQLRLGDKPLQVVLQRRKTSARLLTSKDYSIRGYDYLPPLAGARRSTPVRGTPCTATCP